MLAIDAYGDVHRFDLAASLKYDQVVAWPIHEAIIDEFQNELAPMAKGKTGLVGLADRHLGVGAGLGGGLAHLEGNHAICPGIVVAGKIYSARGEMTQIALAVNEDKSAR